MYDDRDYQRDLDIEAREKDLSFYHNWLSSVYGDDFDGEEAEEEEEEEDECAGSL